MPSFAAFCPSLSRVSRLFSVRALCAGLSLALALAPMPSLAQLPTLDDGSELSIAAERRLGDKIARELYRDPDYIDDPVIEEYVEEIWQRLRAAARVRGELPPELDERFAWRVLLGKDSTVNAFALPGGYFGLHLGLVGVVGNADELASVMAHELSHVTQRHISRLMSQQSRQTPLLLAAMILGVLAAGKNPQAASALITGGQAVAMQSQLNFSRDMEREADRVGFGVQGQAGFAPQGFVTMFEKLQQASRINDNGSYPYLRSHPLTTQRIADIQGRVPASAQAPAKPSLRHAMVSARARVLSEPGVDVLDAWARDARAPTAADVPLERRAAVLYAAALATSRLRDPGAARGHVAVLQKLVEGDAQGMRLARLLAAEIELAAGNANASLQIEPPVAQPRPELLLSSEALQRIGRAGEAAPALQTWVAGHPLDAPAWRALAAASQARDQPLRALRAEAEAQAAALDYAAAIDRFKAGQALARTGGQRFDFVDASIIDTRLREVERLQKEQLADK